MYLYTYNDFQNIFKSPNDHRDLLGAIDHFWPKEPILKAEILNINIEERLQLINSSAYINELEISVLVSVQTEKETTVDFITFDTRFLFVIEYLVAAYLSNQLNVKHYHLINEFIKTEFLPLFVNDVFNKKLETIKLLEIKNIEDVICLLNDQQQNEILINQIEFIE